MPGIGGSPPDRTWPSCRIGILVAYFGFERVGRSLIVDSALAMGLGTRLPDAQVTVGTCEYDATRAGSRLPGHWRCPVTVVAAGTERELAIETAYRTDDPRAAGAGTFIGETGVRWPLAVLVARWANVLILVLTGGGLMAFASLAFRWSFQARRLSRARRGRVRAVELLTWRGEILRQVGEVQRWSQVRRLLSPEPGDAPTLAGRVQRIEQGPAGKPGLPELRRLYAEAWRLIWDSNDLDVANRALDARDAIALRLGPNETSAALADCRLRYGGT